MTSIADVEALLLRARQHIRTADTEALDFAEEARELAQALGNMQLEAHALCIAAHALFLGQRSNDALTFLSLAQEITHIADVGTIEGLALGLEGRIRFAATDLDSAIDCWEKCLNLADSAIDPEERILALVGLGQIMQWAGEVDTALAFHRQAELLAESQQNEHLLNVAQIQVAHDLAEKHDYSAAQTLLHDLQPHVVAEGNYAFEAEVYELSGEIWLGRGQIDKASARLVVALKIYRLLGNLWGQADCLLAQARCHLARAETEDAIGLLDEVREITATFPAPGIRSALFLTMAEALAQRGDAELAHKAELEYAHLQDTIRASAAKILAPPWLGKKT